MVPDEQIYAQELKDNAVPWEASRDRWWGRGQWRQQGPAADRRKEWRAVVGFQRLLRDPAKGEPKARGEQKAGLSPPNRTVREGWGGASQAQISMCRLTSWFHSVSNLASFVLAGVPAWAYSFSISCLPRGVAFCSRTGWGGYGTGHDHTAYQPHPPCGLKTSCVLQEQEDTILHQQHSVQLHQKNLQNHKRWSPKSVYLTVLFGQ